MKSLLVVWSSAPALREGVLRRASERARPVCVLEDVDRWEALELNHTPVTLLVRNGRILLVERGSLTDSLALAS